MSKKLYEENNIRSIGDAIRAKNGTSNTYTTAQMAEAVRSIETQSDLEELSASENGIYTPSSGKDGFSRAVVNVQPKLEELNASENGAYTPSSGKDGFSRVNINVPSGSGSAILVPKTITANGTYNALLDDDADGYSEVVVNVNGSEEPLKNAIHIWTKSTGSNDASMYYQFGVWNDEHTVFSPTSEIMYCLYLDVSGYVQGTAGDIVRSRIYYPIINQYPFLIGYNNTQWSVASIVETKCENTIYQPKTNIKLWGYLTAVDFYIDTI